MGLFQAIQSSMDSFSKKHFGAILLYGLWVVLLLLLLTTTGLIGAGCVILGTMLGSFLIFFSPILVPLGIIAGLVTLMTLFALTAAGIITWRWKDKDIHRTVKKICRQAKLKEHGKETRTKCNRCNGKYLTPAGLKFHQKKCVVDLSDDNDTEDLVPVHSIDSGETFDESRNSIFETAFLLSSSSLGLSESRHREDSLFKIKASCSKRLTEDMRRALFGLPTAAVALIFAHEKGIGVVDDEFLEAILNEGEALFKILQSSSSGINGPVGPSQMEEFIQSDLLGVNVKLTFSQGISNPQVNLAGKLNRKELFVGLRTFSKQGKFGVLQVGEFYMALVSESSDLLYVLNPGVGTSSGKRDLSDNFEAQPSLMKCHRYEMHRLVDQLIHYFTIEHPRNDLEYVILPVCVAKIE